MNEDKPRRQQKTWRRTKTRYRTSRPTPPLLPGGGNPFRSRPLRPPPPPRCRARGPSQQASNDDEWRAAPLVSRLCDWLAPWGTWLPLLRVGWFPDPRRRLHHDSIDRFAAVICCSCSRAEQTPHFFFSLFFFFRQRREGRASPVCLVVGARRLGMSDP